MREAKKSSHIDDANILHYHSQVFVITWIIPTYQSRFGLNIAIRYLHPTFQTNNFKFTVWN